MEEGVEHQEVHQRREDEHPQAPGHSHGAPPVLAEPLETRPATNATAFRPATSAAGLQQPPPASVGPVQLRPAVLVRPTGVQGGRENPHDRREKRRAGRVHREVGQPSVEELGRGRGDPAGPPGARDQQARLADERRGEEEEERELSEGQQRGAPGYAAAGRGRGGG